MPYIVPSPASSPPTISGLLPNAKGSISFRLDSSDSLPTLDSQCSSNTGSEDEAPSSLTSSPPTPETPLPSSRDISPTQKTQTSNLSIPSRAFRNHVRSHSHDAIVSRPPLHYRQDSSDSTASNSSNTFIYLQPTSPSVREKDGFLISDPVMTETSPRTKTKLSLFDLHGTEWPEGESTEATEDLASAQPEETSQPWVPPAHQLPSTSFSFGVSPSSTTPKARPDGKRDLRIQVQPTAINGRALGTSSNQPSNGSPPMLTPMVRKKSGELVRSSLKHNQSSHLNLVSAAARAEAEAVAQEATQLVRAKSAPATPTGPKAVHFDKQLEHVKLFLAQQRPAAVSRQGTPGETTEDDSEAYPFPIMTSVSTKVSLILPNFPNPVPPTSSGRDVFLSSLEILQDSKMLRGVIVVKNLAFHKRVVVRFTMDDWQTISETTAEFYQPLEGGQYDQWVFRIKLADMLARIEEKKMLLAIKYAVNGGEIWDNNEGKNYVINFKKEQPAKVQSNPDRKASKYQWAVTTAGQASERMEDLRKVLDRLVHEEDAARPPVAPLSSGSSFANRYSLGASLKQHPGRTASNGLSAPAPKPFFHPITTSTIMGGMPASVVEPTQMQPRYASHNANGVFQPDHDYVFHDYPAFAGEGAQRPFPHQNESGSPQQGASLGDATSIRQDRFNSFPQSKWDSYPSPLAAQTPRLFDDEASTPFWAMAGQRGRSAVVASLDSPRDQSPTPAPGSRRPQSPPSGVASFDSSAASSNNSSYASPSSPSAELPPQTYHGFLEKYCFGGNTKSALGLFDAASPPLGGGHFDSLLTPRACATSYIPSVASSGSTTPSKGSPLVT